MLTNDLISETYTAITVNKARTFLTILGIVIGIGSVITMTAVGRGAQNDIEERIQGIGANLLMIRAGGGGRGGFGPTNTGGNQDSLTTEDVDMLRQDSQYLSYVAPQASGRYQVIAGGNNVNTTVLGTTSDYASVYNSSVERGSFLTLADDKKLSRVVVLGSQAALDLFGDGTTLESDPVGDSVRINGVTFTVIGLLAQKGDNDDTIYAPLGTVQQYLIGEKTVSSIDVSVTNSQNMTVAEEELNTMLLEAHGITDETEADFRIRNQADIIETASSVTGALTALLAAIASISLLVGGIGIMNMMLTSVTERTREIGLRKALGATVGDIRRQFLLEAVTLTFLGGLLGVLSGIGIAWFLDSNIGLSTSVSQSSVVLAFSVSALIGVIFGLYPAWRASKFDPMEALRYE
ncbi:MAG: ABC transporter permease [Candidatus Moranbacteria bacterium]|nr:ABC transporter permease [Candidatus Moranbacteria bacterium]